MRRRFFNFAAAASAVLLAATCVMWTKSYGRAQAVNVSRKDLKRREAQQRQARSSARNALHQAVHKIEKQIQDLEARQAELIAELEQQETYDKAGRAQEVNRELVDVQHRLAELNPEWEQAATKLAAAAS